MQDSPLEKIWLLDYGHDECTWCVDPSPSGEDHSPVEYVRADTIATLQAKLDTAVEGLERIERKAVAASDWQKRTKSMQCHNDLAEIIQVSPISHKGTTAMKFHNLKYKSVFRVDTIQRHFRLFRFLWQRGVVGDGSGYSAKLSVGFVAQIISFNRDTKTDWQVVLTGVRIHYCRSYGGIMT